MDRAGPWHLQKHRHRHRQAAQEERLECHPAPYRNRPQIELGAQVVAVVTFVGQQLSWALFGIGQQGGGGGNIGRLARRQVHRNRQSMRLGQHMDLGAEAATRPA